MYTPEDESEAVIQNRIRIALHQLWPGQIILRRNNNGTAVYTDTGGNARRVVYGLGKGTSDLVGLIEVDGVAVFLSIEVKRPGQKPTKEQASWLKRVRELGGIAGIADSVTTATTLVAQGIADVRRQRRAHCSDD